MTGKEPISSEQKQVLSEVVKALKGMRQLVCWQEQLIRQTLKALGRDQATDAGTGRRAAPSAKTRKASGKRSTGRKDGTPGRPKRRT